MKVVPILLIILIIIFVYIQRGNKSPMSGGEAGFKNLCFTDKPRGFYFPSCGNWRPRHLIPKPDEQSQTSCQLTSPWTGAQLSDQNLQCQPDFINYEASYYANPSDYCQQNSKQRLCPNHWIGARPKQDE